VTKQQEADHLELLMRKMGHTPLHVMLPLRVWSRIGQIREGFECANCGYVRAIGGGTEEESVPPCMVIPQDRDGQGEQAA
jgi:hypothetical protein